MACRFSSFNSICNWDSIKEFPYHSTATLLQDKKEKKYIRASSYPKCLVTTHTSSVTTGLPAAGLLEARDAGKVRAAPPLCVFSNQNKWVQTTTTRVSKKRKKINKWNRKEKNRKQGCVGPVIYSRESMWKVRTQDENGTGQKQKIRHQSWYWDMKYSQKEASREIPYQRDKKKIYKIKG